MQGKQLITPPAITPVSISIAKAHERIDLPPNAANDELIQYQLFAATEMAQNFTRRAFITQTWLYQTSNIGPVIEIPRPRLQSIIPYEDDPESMIFTDWNNVTYPIYQDTWFVDTTPEPGLLIFKAGASPFPFLFGGWWGWSGPVGYLQLKFTAGWGDTGEDTPVQVRHAILQIFGHLYENREGQPLIPGSIAYDLLRYFQVDYL